jgi:hypothetical protein
MLQLVWPVNTTRGAVIICLVSIRWEEKAAHLGHVVTIYLDELDKRTSALQAKNPDLNIRTCPAITIPLLGQTFGRCINITH